MIRKQQLGRDEVKVTFSLADDGRAVSLVGDFNNWNPEIHPLRRRSNGTRSVAIVLENGQRASFRYLAEEACFFDDPEGDVIEPNGIGQTHTVIVAAA
jgi:1,4-alpha-glucan branching enzyme